MSDQAARELRSELEAGTPDVWPRVLHSIAARRIATELLAALDRPPSPQSQLGWELRLRISESMPLREVA
jgi:hypothetical protein